MSVIAPLKLRAGLSSQGLPVYEEVLAERLGPKHYRLTKSPGLVLGLAAGDEFQVDEEGAFQVTKYGQNICIQIFSRSAVNACEQRIAPDIDKLGGWLDGKAEKELVFTVPVSVGFQRIEEVLNGAAADLNDYEWYYGNVYDPVDGVTPLNWWVSTQG